VREGERLFQIVIVFYREFPFTMNVIARGIIGLICAGGVYHMIVSYQIKNFRNEQDQKISKTVADSGGFKISTTNDSSASSQGETSNS
jgi:hypothetical protein